ncbi:MAG: hypothetical protein NXI24_18895 [bacterium]|nr:hypothetical protein [bacterium]
MAVPLLPRLLKTFYRTGLNVLPVVQQADPVAVQQADPVAVQQADPGTDSRADSDLELQGFALRSELDQFMADLDRARGDFGEIPPEILVRDRVPPAVLTGLQNRGEIPVIDLRGEQLANWSEARFLKALAVFREKHNVPAPTGASEGPGSEQIPDVSGRSAKSMTFSGAGAASGAAFEDGSENAAGASRWLGEILLAAIPYALFATDLQGNTLFYNGRFEESILTKRALKNSIRLAESFFLELTRTLLARSFEEDPLRRQRNALTTYHEELETRVRIQNLEQDGRIQGYLYIFQEPGAGELFHELVDRVNRGQGLEDVIDDVEGRFIYLMLGRHGQNVSHTARALKIKRSTLQNKIKRLRIDERYNRKIEGPVRRHRRTVAEILAERESQETTQAPAAKKPKAVAKKTVRKTAQKPAVRKTASKKAAKQAGKQASKKLANKPAKKTARKVSKKAASKAAKKVAKKAATRTPKKAPGKSSKKKPAKKSARR